MKRPMLLLFVILVVLVSCRTEHFVTPEPVNLGPSVQMLFDSRPKDELFQVKDVKDVADIVDNSATYLMAWELWESYALSLEDYIVFVRDVVSR